MPLRSLSWKLSKREILSLPLPEWFLNTLPTWRHFVILLVYEIKNSKISSFGTISNLLSSEEKCTHTYIWKYLYIFIKKILFFFIIDPRLLRELNNTGSTFNVQVRGLDVSRHLLQSSAISQQKILTASRNLTFKILLLHWSSQ